ncbi:hypothetical protein AB0K02_28775 [Streptomyces sp. NPDC049597]|uniref:hypothetical protein n=1 Tax=Streptomyces sp. NPDC049597 TaxID=3155276 RepID=UPI00343CDF5A
MGDIDSLRLVRDGEGIGQTGFPLGVFEIPSDDALCELSLNQAEIAQPAAVRKRSTQLLTAWKFRSRLDESAYSRGIPPLFLTGHTGYEPGEQSHAKPN